MDCIILADGSRLDVADLLDNGSDGFIFRRGVHVLKIPKLFGRLLPSGEVTPFDENDMHRDHLETEKRIYRRLGKTAGIATCIDITANGILLEYYPGGSLRQYLLEQPAPSTQQRWQWALQATQAIAYCHEHGVLVYDIALRNFLVAADNNLRLIDFANSILLSEGVNIQEEYIEGATAALDLLHLSNVIYSIVSWQEFRISCAAESEWPSDGEKPSSSQDVDVDEMVRKCWSKEYRSVHELLQEVQRFSQTKERV